MNSIPGFRAAPSNDCLLMFLCDGNLARSPAAELISRHRAVYAPSWSFASCGARAVRSDQVMTNVAKALADLGVPADGFHSRQARTPMLREATLILTADARQNAWIADEAPGLFRRTYLIGQAARLLADLPAGADPRAYLERVRDRPRAEDEIDDPHRTGPEAAQRAVREIDEALSIILPALGAVRPPQV